MGNAAENKTTYHDLPAEEMLAKLTEFAERFSSLEQSNDALHTMNTSLKEKIDQLKCRVLQLQQALFGRKKEILATEPCGMKLLFDEIEEAAASEESAANSSETPVAGHARKNRGKRQPLPDYLPRERQEFELEGIEKVCAIHQVDLIKVGEKVSEKLDIVPAVVKVIQQVVFQYKCPCCDDGGFRSAVKDQDPIPKSFATPGLLAYIAVSKFDDALPLNRQEKIFRRCSIDLGRTTMARWMIRSAELARPLYNLLHDDLIETPVIHVDETTVQVLREENRRPESNSYMWCLARQRFWAPIIYFRYFDNRSGAAAQELLQEFAGTVVADAYKVYRSVARKNKFTLAGCMAHARRKFWEAEKIAKQQAKKGDSIISSHALVFIRELYAIEQALVDKPPDEIHQVRQTKSKPIIEAFLGFLEAERLRVVSSSPTGKAIAYALNNWIELTRFLDDGQIAIDNNYLEAHIRPFTIGRNNWVFSATPAGAESSAILYSLVQTAKVNGLDPYDYLRLIFKKLPKAQSLDDYEKLLPYRAAEHFPVKPL